MAQQAPPGFFIINAFEPSGPFGRVRDMFDLETLVGGAYDDTTHVESQRQDAGRRARSIGLGAQDSPTRHHGAFEDLQTRLFGHARSLHWPVFEENGLSPRKSAPIDDDHDGESLVRPDGLAIRRRRHDNGWSPRELSVAIENACVKSSGVRRSLTPNQLKGIEEQGERISYDQLLLLADGLDCDPVDLIAEGEFSSRPTPRRMN